MLRNRLLVLLLKVLVGRVGLLILLWGRGCWLWHALSHTIADGRADGFANGAIHGVELGGDLIHGGLHGCHFLLDLVLDFVLDHGDEFVLEISAKFIQSVSVDGRLTRRTWCLVRCFGLLLYAFILVLSAWEIGKITFKIIQDIEVASGRPSRGCTVVASRGIFFLGVAKIRQCRGIRLEGC